MLARLFALPLALSMLASTSASAQGYQVMRSDDPGYGAMQRKIEASDRGWAQVSRRYLRQPDIDRCDPGQLRPELSEEFLARLNALRRHHGLSPVRLAHEYDREMAETALIMAANSQLSHFPGPNWRCHSTAGATGAGTSNLAGGGNSQWLLWGDEDAMLGDWMREHGSTSIGHRRWLLDPFLSQVSYGRVSAVGRGGERQDAAALKVFGFSGQDGPAPALPPFVAYPFGDYPAQYFAPGDRMSLSVVASDRGSFASSRVDYSSAQVHAWCNERPLRVHSLRYDNEGFGLANVIEWRAEGILPDTRCVVKVSGVRGAPQDEYAWSFRSRS